MADLALTISPGAVCQTQRVVLPGGERTWTMVFLGWLRSGDGPGLASIERRPARFSEGTVALRLQAVCSLYRYHHFNGVDAASRLYERVFSGRHAYKPMLEHLARRRGHERRVVRVSRPRPATPPTLTPEQVGLILDACAEWEPAAREWRGSVRDRLLWALLAESGMRLGETLALPHRDWHTGLGDTPFVEVVPREDHARAAGQERWLPAHLHL